MHVHIIAFSGLDKFDLKKIVSDNKLAVMKHQDINSV